MLLYILSISDESDHNKILYLYKNFYDFMIKYSTNKFQSYGMPNFENNAEDAVQNTFMKISKHIKKIDFTVDKKRLKTAIASAESVKIGKATIFSTVSGELPGEYKIEIVKIDKNNKENKNYVIKIVDDALIEQTGGIVQGMSGSPILQNGNLVGAITHVFVNDPTRGYGISIDEMMGMPCENTIFHGEKTLN